MKLEWDYDGAGNWNAASQFHDEGSPFHWSISVCVDGTFDVSDSDSEISNRPQDESFFFPTLDAAKAWCDQQEAQMVHDSKAEGNGHGPS